MYSDLDTGTSCPNMATADLSVGYSDPDTGKSFPNMVTDDPDTRKTCLHKTHSDQDTGRFCPNMATPVLNVIWVGLTAAD